MSWTPRAVGATYLKAIAQSVFPKQIEIGVELPKEKAHYSGLLVPQVKQVRPLETLNGIYRFESLDDGTQQLVWCFANSDTERPAKFEVGSGSNRTMVTLQRIDSEAPDPPWAKSVVSKKLLSMLD